MSMFTGRQRKGAMREHRDQLRAEAEERNSAHRARLAEATREVEVEQATVDLPAEAERAVVTTRRGARAARR